MLAKQKATRLQYLLLAIVDATTSFKVMLMTMSSSPDTPKIASKSYSMHTGSIPLSDTCQNTLATAISEAAEGARKLMLWFF